MAAIDPVRRHRLTVDDFHKLASTGVICEDARVELIDGELIDMAPIGSRHAGMVYLLNHLLTTALSDKAIVGAQNPVVLGIHSQPQADILVLRRREDYYRSSHPTPEDVLLLVEIVDTTGEYDRKVKIPLYARHEIPELWLVDLTKNCLEIYRTPQPKHQSYRQVELCYEGVVSPLHLPSVAIDVARLF